jgi:D-arabinose 1-dehydrogenase-like Zn-dependent alcohol dehydrogenase
MSSAHTDQEFKAFAAYEAKGQLKPFTYTPRPLGEEDVDIRITHCGICSSDLHTIDSGWGPSNYPGTLTPDPSPRGGVLTMPHSGSRP